MAQALRETVYIVDDEKMNRLVLSSLVSRLGFSFREFESGKEAVSAFETALVAGSPIAAIIMDINMPGMDGLEAVWRIRGLEEQKRQACSCQDAVVPPSAFPSLQHQEGSTEIILPGREIVDSRTGLCDGCKAMRTPVWAVSACSEQEQARSPAMRLIAFAGTGPPWKLAGFDTFIPKPMPRVQLINMLSRAKREIKMPLNFQNKEASSAAISEASSQLTTIPLNKFASCHDLESDNQELAPTEVHRGEPESVMHICTPAS